MMTLQDAKNRFSAVVDAALAGHPQEVSRRGKPAVVVMAVADYRRLLEQARTRRESFGAHLLGFPDEEGTRLDPDATGGRAPVVPRDIAF